MERYKRRLGVFAGLFLAFASLALAVYQTKVLVDLLNNGTRTHGIVLQIKVGAKGSKRAVLQFHAADGTLVQTPDVFQSLFKRPQKGDRVTIIYDTENPKIATIDNDGWVWQSPGFLYFSSVFFFVLILFLNIYSSKKN